MKVQATERGFFGGALKEPGDVFDVKKAEFSEEWMEKYSAPEPEPAEEPDEAPSDESAGDDG